MGLKGENVGLKGKLGKLFMVFAPETMNNFANFPDPRV